MEISTHEKIFALKDKGESPLYSIWIVHEEQDDNTFDIHIWDEIENERNEAMEEGYFSTLREAEKALIRIVEENSDITFVRLENQKS